MTHHPFRRAGLAVGTLLLAASTLTWAESSDRVDQRQDRQDQRIERGVQSGALTRPEARRLARQQASIARTERRAEADGHVTHREAARLEHRQDRASARIARQKHDRQTRQR